MGLTGAADSRECRASIRDVTPSTGAVGASNYCLKLVCRLMISRTEQGRLVRHCGFRFPALPASPCTPLCGAGPRVAANLQFRECQPSQFFGLKHFPVSSKQC